MIFWPDHSESNDSESFYVEQSSNEPSPPRLNTPIVLNSTETSVNNSWEVITLSSISSPSPQTVSINSDSNERALPYGLGQQPLNIPPSLDDLNLTPNSFIILANLVVAKPTSKRHEENSPHHWSRRNHHQCRRPQRTSAQLRDGRRHIRQRMTIHFNLMMNPAEFSFYPPVLPPAANSKNEKKNRALEWPSQKEGECRSTSAKLVDTCSLNRRTYQARRQQTKNSTSKISYI